jgi:hypothetical protein
VVDIVSILIPSAAGAVTASAGILTYWRGQQLKRKEILFPLIEELSNSKSLFLAKAVLDDFTCNVPEFSENDSVMVKNTLAQDLNGGKTTAATWKQHYTTRNNNLDYILRYHEKEGDVTDYREIIVRASFDALIKFCAKLEYLKDIGLLNEDELVYFEYYYDKLLLQQSVCNYIDKYRLSLKGSLFNHQGIRKCGNKVCWKCNQLRQEG